MSGRTAPRAAASRDGDSPPTAPTATPNLSEMPTSKGTKTSTPGKRKKTQKKKLSESKLEVAVNMSSGEECEPLDSDLDSDGWGDISIIPGAEYSPFHQHSTTCVSESSSVSEGSERRRRRVKRARVLRSGGGESGERHSPSRQRVGREGSGSGSRDGVGLLGLPSVGQQPRHDLSPSVSNTSPHSIPPTPTPPGSADGSRNDLASPHAPTALDVPATPDAPTTTDAPTSPAAVPSAAESRSRSPTPPLTRAGSSYCVPSTRRPGRGRSSTRRPPTQRRPRLLPTSDEDDTDPDDPQPST